MSNQITRQHQVEPSLAALLKIAEDNADKTKSLVKAIQLVADENSQHSKVLAAHTRDIEQLKFDVEITDQEASYITAQVKKLAVDTVGYPSPLYMFCIQDIYRNLRSHWNMGGKVRTTKRGNLETVLEGLIIYKPDIKQLEERLQAKLESEINQEG